MLWVHFSGIAPHDYTIQPMECKSNLCKQATKALLNVGESVRF